MEFRILVDDIRVLSIDGRLMAVINTTADEMETAVKDRPGTLTDRCQRLAEMVRETQTPEPAEVPQPKAVKYEYDHIKRCRICNASAAVYEHRFYSVKCSNGHELYEHTCAADAIFKWNVLQDEPAEVPQYVPEPVYNPIQRRLDDGWPASVSEKARQMFGGADVR